MLACTGGRGSPNNIWKSRCFRPLILNMAEKKLRIFLNLHNYFIVLYMCICFSFVACSSRIFPSKLCFCFGDTTFQLTPSNNIVCQEKCDCSYWQHVHQLLLVVTKMLIFSVFCIHKGKIIAGKVEYQGQNVAAQIFLIVSVCGTKFLSSEATLLKKCWPIKAHSYSTGNRILCVVVLAPHSTNLQWPTIRTSKPKEMFAWYTTHGWIPCLFLNKSEACQKGYKCTGNVACWEDMRIPSPVRIGIKILPRPPLPQQEQLGKIFSLGPKSSFCFGDETDLYYIQLKSLIIW